MFKGFLSYKQQTKAPKGSYMAYTDKHNLAKEELRECPICITDFDVYDQVIGLKCSILHIYHKDCLKQMISQGENKCSMCR